MDWKEIIQNLGLFTIATGFISWLLKKLGEYFLDKRFKSFEMELQLKSDNYKLELDKGLETYKADLTLQHVKKERLHNKRSEILEELYKRIVDLDFAMRELTAVFKQVKSDYDAEERERIDKAGNAYNEFLKYSRVHKLYFNEETTKKLDNLTAKYFDTLWDYSDKQLKLADRETMKNVYKNINEEIPKILADIDADFKKYLE